MHNTIPTQSIKVSVCLRAYYSFDRILVCCVRSEFTVSFESLLRFLDESKYFRESVLW